MSKKEKNVLNLRDYNTTNVPPQNLDPSDEVEASEWVDSWAEHFWGEDGVWDTLSALSQDAPSGKEILEAGVEITEMLLQKNISYGNSALQPLRLFSNSSTEEQIFVRLDDKLSRLKNNQSYPGDNDIDDLIGYLILLKVARRISWE